MSRDSERRPSRRDFLALGAGGLLVAATPGMLRPRRQVVRRTVPVMGTIADIAVVHRDERYAHRAIDAAVAELRRVDATMTRFSPHSEVGRANLAAARGPVAVGAATAEVVAAALAWADRSDGAFDPCLGGAVALWDVAHRAAPPAAAEVRRFAGRGLHRSLELGRRGGSDVIVYHEPDIALDLGGIAKGYGVDRAAAALRDWGIADALVNVGGDLQALGVSPDGDAWEVGVRDPADPARLAARFRVSDRAVATSGDYEQFFEHGGRRYHHLLDPATGEPRVGASHAVTIVADRCMDADAAGTAVFGMDRGAAERRIAAMDPRASILHIG
ncbi:MAG TPA: FAD:protein FMN transferase [Longimicrobiales bacterium]|nr:FAD:protein FMN transferase [Longimicrobiales bacterium]